MGILDGPSISYRARDDGGEDNQGKTLSLQQATDLLDRDTVWPSEITLKVGAMVMLCVVSDFVTRVKTSADWAEYHGELGYSAWM
jgi:hypothetical protein